MSASDSSGSGSNIDSTLCVRCLNIPFDMFLGEQRTYELHSAKLELEISAMQCVACKFWESTLPWFYEPGSPVILSSLGEPKIHNGLDHGAGGISVPLTCQAESSGQRGSSWGDFDYFTSNSLSRDSIDLMRALIDDCINSHDHPLCGGFQEFSDAPSRLLFVGDAVTGPRLQVISTSELSEIPVYVALSHCWGSVAENAPWKLSKTTVVVFQHEVPESFLPLTFVDAVNVTRALGRSYLWIDSLCILQDCSADWELESSKMAGIYANALCTLGSASDSAQGGCVGVRSRCDNFRLRLALGTITFYRGEHHVLENGPISRRAWCLQERVLARRFIQFSELGFMWFCAWESVLEYNFLSSMSSADSDLPLLERRKSNCKAEPIHYPLLPMGSDFASGSPFQASEQRSSLLQGWDIEEHSELYVYWYMLVVEYSRREITKPRDRLPAIAGLAQLVAKRLPEDLYIMGLWLCDLGNGLLWTVSWERQTRELSSEIAPSWSWLSQDIVKYYTPRSDATELYGESMVPTYSFLSAIDKNISPFPLLRILAPLVRVKCVEDYEGPHDYRLDVCDERLWLVEPGRKRGGVGQTSLTVNWDRWPNPSYVGAIFHCLLLVARRVEFGTLTSGLLLECVDSTMNLYRRMGAFSIYRKYNNSDFWSSEAVWERFRGLEREEFYIK